MTNPPNGTPSGLPTDNEFVQSVARRYRLESIATLLSVCRNDAAPATARSAAAAKLLEYSDGRPSQAKQITVADLQNMSDASRMELLTAIVQHYAPDGFKLLVQEAVDKAIALQDAEREAWFRSLPRLERRAPVIPAPSISEIEEVEKIRATQEVLPPLPPNVHPIRPVPMEPINSSRSISPDVVRRSGSMAMDRTFSDYHKPWYR